MSQTLQDIVTRLCAYGLELKDFNGTIDHWGTLLLALELAYKKSIHFSTNQTLSIIEKGWNIRIPQDLVEINSQNCQLQGNSIKSREAFEDFILVSTTNFNNLKGCKNLEESFAGPSFIKALHGEISVELELSKENSNKHPTVPLRLIKPYKACDNGTFNLRSKVSQHIPLVEKSGT
ncbi:hypothetical protein O181_014064 [Austropuccinia psidii MF-1]|uniref:Uncharacterized protein n=1 Tax=Austropuccinia psidii MF-1 TaxID=1389203 RepID=A0A9Q3BZF7_9BASI|nr:hypothetical protein [Austropuccinia psidii MF-1]